MNREKYRFGFEIEEIREIASIAAEAIMDIYNTSFEDSIAIKKDDTPVTIADLRSNEIITSFLGQLSASYPVFSEESLIPEYDERKKIDRFWLIDPLDGTKEFINRNGDFSINIALIEKTKPVFGHIFLPVTKEEYWGLKDQASFVNRMSKTSIIKTSTFSSRQAGIRFLTFLPKFNY